MTVIGVTVSVDLQRGENVLLSNLNHALKQACMFEALTCFRIRISWDEWMTVHGRRVYGEMVRMIARDFPFKVVPVLCCSPTMGDRRKSRRIISPEFAAAFTDEVLAQWEPYLDDYAELWNGAPLGPQWSQILLSMAGVVKARGRKVLLGARHGPTATEYAGLNKLLEHADAFGLWWRQWHLSDLHGIRQSVAAPGGKGVFWLTETECFARETSEESLERFRRLLAQRPPRMFWHRLQNEPGQSDGFLDEHGRLTRIGAYLLDSGNSLNDSLWNGDPQQPISYRYH